MAVLPICITGEPVLHSPARPVVNFDESLRALVADLIDTMEAAPGVGLAAPQVGIPLRVFVYRWTDDDDTLFEGVAVNPELWLSTLSVEPLDEDDESEGCLSVPGERHPLRRAEHVILRARDVDGSSFEIVADGWLARIFQHEYDHLDGVLYADRLEAPFAKAVAKVIRKKNWGVPDLTWMPGEDHLDD